MGLNSKIHLVTNVQGRIIKILVTNRTKTDCKVVFALIKNIKTDIVIADRVYNTNDISEYTKNNSTVIVISLESNRKLKMNFDNYLYS